MTLIESIIIIGCICLSSILFGYVYIINRKKDYEDNPLIGLKKIYEDSQDAINECKNEKIKIRIRKKK